VKYRKKPVVIDAFQVKSLQECVWPSWAMTHENLLIETDSQGTVTGYLIETLEGDMRVSVGDWIIKGVKGEIYPCKPDIFDASYEAVA
jgi:hypothetical protein